MSKIKGNEVYKSVKVKTSNSGQIIVLLYTEAINQLQIAIDLIAMKDKQHDKINNAVSKARNIITELAASLDRENGGKFAETLFSLYMWFNERITLGSIKKNRRMIEEVLNSMQELKNAWGIAAEQTKSNEEITKINPKRGLDISS